MSQRDDRSSLYFNPPSPWGEGPRKLFWTSCASLFQSTLPVGGGTILQRIKRIFDQISIHPPCGGEGRSVIQRSSRESGISIHPPRGGRDVRHQEFRLQIPDFNPPSPWGEVPVMTEYCPCIK